MKDQFLKLAGVKSDKEFYKLFPDEKTFMAKYGKQVKKLQLGETLGKATGAIEKLAGSNAFATGVQSVGDIVGGIQQMKDEKQMMLGAQQMQGVSNVALQASRTRPEQIQRKYSRPEIMQPEQFQNLGQGTNILSAKNGGEITNTFAPNTIYKDLKKGGKLRTAENGFLSNMGNQDFMKFNKAGEESDIYKFAQEGGGSALSQITAGLGSPKGYGVSGAGKIGGGIGSTAGMLIGGPIGSMVGKFAGQTIGNLVDRKAEKTEKANLATNKNINTMGFQSGIQNLNSGNVSYMEHGGNVNPQIIKQFGDYTMNQLLQPDPMMDTLRSGGNLREYTPPSGRALQTYEQGGEINSYGLGGQLQTHWGGGAETISRNPYLPGTGETIMFRGKSHEEYSPNGETGIGVTYGGNPVEVERGEPMVELQEGGVVDPATGEVQKSGVVFGNLQIPDQYIPMLGDKNAKGKKFKTYVDDLSKTEANQNKLVSSSSKKLDDLNVDSPYDKLSFSGLQANLLGANMKLKDIADKKIKAASLQSAINDTAEEYGFVADDLAKGKVTKAKMGASIAKAIDGINQPIDSVTKEERAKAKQLYESGDVEGFQKYAQEIAPDIVKNIIREKGMPAAGTFADKLKGPRTEEVYNQIMNPILSELPGSRLPGRGQIELPRNMPGVSTEKRGGQPASEVAKESPFDWMSIANQVLPYVRPSDAEQLDPRQLSGEMFALATNQLQPVQAQTFQPQLGTPYDISLQDQLNANQSDYRALQRMTGYNPAAQGMLNAQKYSANQQVLGEQFRANQAMKDKVYGENRQLLNESNLKNLAIYDQQYDRQASALANTKATTQAALNSIASKYAQNQLENRNLQTYENLYNYRFDSQGRAINMNPLAQFSPQGSGSPDLSTMSSEQIKQLAEIKKMEELEAKKAKEVASKTSRNGSIVKSYKNL